MDFFQAQDDARRRTRLLVVLLVLAVGVLVALINIVAVIFVASLDANGAGAGLTALSQRWAASGTDGLLTYLQSSFCWQVSGLVLLTIFGASALRWMELGQGGKAVAEALGGQCLSHRQANPRQARLLHVVEEMALAAGLPVPPGYELSAEAGINAFAAGLTVNDAVIGITRGAIDQLDRDQLQGVIAHEFSHILNGDMRLNMLLVALLNGILFIANAGRGLVRSQSEGRGSRGRGSGQVLLLGLALWLLGSVGLGLGQLIRAAVCRQREFLADASAVQFTRNPEGIAGALQRIGGWASGSTLAAPRAAELNHLFLGSALSHLWDRWLASHPPLEERIRRLQPGWNGCFINAAPDALRRESAPVKELPPIEYVPERGGGADHGQPLLEAVASVGRPNPASLSCVQRLTQSWPDAVKGAVAAPSSAQALVVALLLSHAGTSSVNPTAWSKLAGGGAHGEAWLAELDRLRQHIARLPVEQYLPLLETCIPTLKQMARQDYEAFMGLLKQEVAADGELDLFEWCLYRLLASQLAPAFARPRVWGHQGTLTSCQGAVLIVLAGFARYGHDVHADGAAQAGAAFTAALQSLGWPPVPMPEFNQKAFDAGVMSLIGLKPLQKPRLLKAVAASISHDRVVTRREADLLRTVSALLDCPMPPLEDGVSAPAFLPLFDRPEDQRQ